MSESKTNWWEREGLIILQGDILQPTGDGLYEVVPETIKPTEKILNKIETLCILGSLMIALVGGVSLAFPLLAGITAWARRVPSRIQPGQIWVAKKANYRGEQPNFIKLNQVPDSGFIWAYEYPGEKLPGFCIGNAAIRNRLPIHTIQITARELQRDYTLQKETK